MAGNVLARTAWQPSAAARALPNTATLPGAKGFPTLYETHYLASQVYDLEGHGKAGSPWNNRSGANCSLRRPNAIQPSLKIFPWWQRIAEPRRTHIHIYIYTYIYIYTVKARPVHMCLRSFSHLTRGFFPKPVVAAASGLEGGISLSNSAISDA